MGKRQAAKQWTEEEFVGLDLGDARLNKRVRKLMETLAAKPMASIAQAYGSWADTRGAYRFFAHSEVSWEGILARTGRA